MSEEYVRDVKIVVVIDTNKRDIRETFDDIEDAIEWLNRFAGGDA